MNHATFQAARSASKARSTGKSTGIAAELAKNQAVNTYWMGTLDAGDVDVTFDESSDVSQVTVQTTITYESLTGWFEDGVMPDELKSKAVTPY